MWVPSIHSHNASSFQHASFILIFLQLCFYSKHNFPPHLLPTLVSFSFVPSNPHLIYRFTYCGILHLHSKRAIWSDAVEQWLPNQSSWIPRWTTCPVVCRVTANIWTVWWSWGTRFRTTAIEQGCVAGGFHSKQAGAHLIPDCFINWSHSSDK